MILGWLRLGDKAACGGTVCEGIPNNTSMGKSLTFVGAKIACGHGCVIVGGLPTYTDNGRAIPYHLHSSSRGCPIYSTLNDIDGWEDGKDSAIAERCFQNAEGEWMPIFSPRKHEKCAYDQHLIFEDQDEQLLEGILYRLTDVNGAVIEGTTAIDGKTKIMAGDEGETLDCDIARKVET